MKKLEIHHVLGGKTVVSRINSSNEEAAAALGAFARLRMNDGVYTGDNFAIPARSVELIKVVDQ